ncbi:uncharacterized protein N7496_010471 [Penicillium cataractarum]|uniref:Uncharacterized protein n=1 Tax=Penicillium cataractarum TaxID=2100454 RepID=A0A9W9RQW1_9EURO|nr:uncharacterized protein N7496_010471 [Penicillium cataractarum]KAJ5364758.1 hypothetical protein N7496_010471 [Penicillium cataractarum]
MHSAETSFLVSYEGTKLEEVSLFMNQIDLDGGREPGFAAGKFLCADDTTRELAFMRVYYQIPTSGTEWSPSKVRATQVVPPIKLAELVAFKALIEQECTVIPKLLGYQDGKQLGDGIIPVGFTTRIVWKKVAGVPLSQSYFWNLDQFQRQLIREEFRRVYERISGVRMAVPVDSRRKWTDTSYVTYMLAKAPRRTDWYEHEEEWEF